MKKLFKTIVTIWVIIIFGFFVMLYIGGIDTWERDAAAYPTRHEYIMLNNVAIFRHIFLKLGLPDDSWIAGGLKALSRHYYKNGITHIPEDDAERVHWRYLHYLRPYRGWFLKANEVADQKELIEQAVIVVTQFPERQAKNKRIMEKYAFRDVAYAFVLATETMKPGANPTPEQIKVLVMGAERALTLLGPSFKLYGEEDQGMYGLMTVKSFSFAGAIIFHRWEFDKYNCADPIVDTYVRLRRALPYRMKQVTPHNTFIKFDFNQVSKYQTKVEGILADECNIQLQGT